MLYVQFGWVQNYDLKSFPQNFSIVFHCSSESVFLSNLFLFLGFFLEMLFLSVMLLNFRMMYAGYAFSYSLYYVSISFRSDPVLILEQFPPICFLSFSLTSVSKIPILYIFFNFLLLFHSLGEIFNFIFQKKTIFNDLEHFPAF